MNSISDQNNLSELAGGVKFGKYQILSKIAAGGMAELFLAKQVDFAGISKTVVLKQILPHLADNQDFVQMFLDEARVTAQLNHPNIVQTYEVGHYADIFYIAMEYIRGQNLRVLSKRLRQHPEYKVNPPYTILASIFAQVASGLYYAHNAVDGMGEPLDIVHRDVSPNNLLISYGGHVKIVDFGVAKASSQEHKTQAGNIKGRLSYMSPEQLKENALTPKSDIFSLGVVLYELSTGKRLFKRRTEAGTIQAVLNDPVPPPGEIRPGYPLQLEQIVMRALARDPDERYEDADKLREELEFFMHQEQDYCSAPQIRTLMGELFEEEKNSEFTGSYSRSDLKLLAHRTGHFRGIPHSEAGSGVNNFDHSSSGSLSFSGLQEGSASNSINRPLLREESSSFREALSDDVENELTGSKTKFSPREASDSGLRYYDEEPLNMPPKFSRLGLFLGLILLLGGGGFAFWQWSSTQDQKEVGKQTTPKSKKNTQTPEEIKALVGQLLKAEKYDEAEKQLKKLESTNDAEDHKDWIKKHRIRIKALPQFRLADTFYKNKNLSAARTIVIKLINKYPTFPESQALLDKIETIEAKQLALKKNETDQAKRPPKRRRARRRRSRRSRRRRPKPRKRRRVAMLAKPEERRPVIEEVKMGLLYVNSSPSGRVKLNGRLIGYTPINGKRIKAGRYRIEIYRKGYVASSKTIEINSKRSVDLDVTLPPIPRARPRPVVRRIEPPKRTAPEVRKSPKSALPFSSINLKRKVYLRIYANDPRNIAGPMYSTQHPRLCKKIESEVARILGRGYSTKGVTKAWQSYVRRSAVKRSRQRMVFYPRAVAYLIYKNAIRRRSKRRISQLLVYYQTRNRFKKYINK